MPHLFQKLIELRNVCDIIKTANKKTKTNNKVVIASTNPGHILTW